MQTPPVFKKQEMIRVSKLAERWQCSRQHIYNLIDRGLPAFRFGGKRCVCIPMSEVEKFELNAVVDSSC
jgi:excisionase family DNA binding protein